MNVGRIITVDLDKQGFQQLFDHKVPDKKSPVVSFGFIHDNHCTEVLIGTFDPILYQFFCVQTFVNPISNIHTFHP